MGNQSMSVAEARRRGFLKNVGASQSKYGNKRTSYKGVSYASKKEANRAIELDLLLRAGQITHWEGQVRLPIIYNNVKICTYVADFKVTDNSGNTRYEDTKGYRTDIFKLKKKLVKAFYGIEIIEL